MKNSVILRRCATLHEALICKALLTDRGILASLDNAEHAANDWGTVSALGGVHIRVPISQAQEAKQIIIDQVTQADEILRRTALPGDTVVSTSRWKAMTMLAIYLGLFQLVGGLGLAWLTTMIPSEWLPTINEPEYITGYWEGAGVSPPSPGIDGLVFLFFIVLLLAWELLSTRPTTPNKEPQI